MGMAERTWQDRAENYADGYSKQLTASTAENVIGIDVKRPVVVYSVTLCPSQNNASGEVVLVDGSATGDSGDSRRFRVTVASAATTDRQGIAHADFPRGIVFETGLIVSAATCTGALNISYKPRY
jgi:hypothetical protein